MSVKSKYEQHGPEILELYEKGKNSFEITKILTCKYRSKFSESSIRSFKWYASKQKPEKAKNVVPENKQEQSTHFSVQSKETIENLLYLFSEMDEIYSKQAKNALLQEKSLENLVELEAKYEENIEKYAILNGTLQETITQNEEKRRNKSIPYFIIGGFILTMALAMVVGYNSRRYNNPTSLHYLVVVGYILGGVIAGIGIGIIKKKITAMYQKKRSKSEP